MNNLTRCLMLFFSQVMNEFSCEALTLQQQVERYVQQTYDMATEGELRVSIKNKIALKDWSCPDTINIEHNSITLQSNTQLKLKCITDETFWIRYLPIQIELFQPVLVTQTPLKRGVAIGREHIAYKQLDVNKLTLGYFTDEDEVLGKIVKRNLLVKQVINPMMIDNPLVVNKGDVVVIVAKKGNLQVQMHGIALASGKVGKQIQVRNRRSERVIKAVIKKAGLVEIII